MLGCGLKDGLVSPFYGGYIIIINFFFYFLFSFLFVGGVYSGGDIYYFNGLKIFFIRWG